MLVAMLAWAAYDYHAVLPGLDMEYDVSCAGEVMGGQRGRNAGQMNLAGMIVSARQAEQTYAQVDSSCIPTKPCLSCFFLISHVLGM